MPLEMSNDALARLELCEPRNADRVDRGVAPEKQLLRLGNRCDFDDGAVGGTGVGGGGSGGGTDGVDGPTSSHTLGWDPEDGALSYNVYRALVSELSPTNSGSCYRKDVPSNGTTIPENPSPGEAYAYLISAVTAQGEGSIGDDSDGVERILTNPCD